MPTLSEYINLDETNEFDEPLDFDPFESLNNQVNKIIKKEILDIKKRLVNTYFYLNNRNQFKY